MNDEETHVPDETPPLADVHPISPDALLTPPTPPKLRTALDGFMLTELGNAERFVSDWQPTSRHVANVNWRFFNGMYWKPDDDGEAKRRMAASVRARRANLDRHNDPDAVKALVKWSFTSEASSRINASLALTQIQLPVLARLDDFDHDPDLVTCLNGTIDLRTGELREHTPDDYITNLINGHYEPEATAPRFLKFLDEVSCGRSDWIDALQRAMGYALTAHQGERKMLVWLGDRIGFNGKSQFTKMIASVMGTYAAGADPQLLLTDKMGSRHPTGVMALEGKRFVYTSEVPEAATFDAQRLKALTGDELTLTAHYMRQDFVDFKPRFTLCMSVNTLPYIPPTDLAAWGRLAIFPWTASFRGAAEERSIANPILRTERRGILAWVVRGARLWHEHGLDLPQCVTEMTDKLIVEVDDFARWINERCVISPLGFMPGGQGYTDYSDYVMRVCSAKPMSNHLWARRMRDHATHRKTKTGNVWDGIAIPDEVVYH